MLAHGIKEVLIRGFRSTREQFMSIASEKYASQLEVAP
jgi:hypothetical protein